MNTTNTESPALALMMPYPGLRGFEEADQPLFFGRDEQVAGLLRQLEDSALVAVVGASGCGKSSLVRAGLLPHIREGFLFGTTDWGIAVIRPGHDPYQRVTHKLASLVQPGAVDEQQMLRLLKRSDRGLLAAIDELAADAEMRVLVVIDQFEELFAFRRASAAREDVASRDEAAAFVAMLLRAAGDPDSRVRVVLTMRSDFIGDCEAFLGLPEAISHNQFLVPRLTRGQMQEVIVGPSRVSGAAFEPFEFESGLVTRLINDAGDRPDQLPLLQHALMRTWKLSGAAGRCGETVSKRHEPEARATVTHRNYEEAGGIEQALSNHADAAWNKIKSDSKKALLAQRLFLLLCDISHDGQVTRRRPRVQEILDVTGASLAEVEAIVRLFQADDRNFLLPLGNQPLTAETRLDVSHEALLRRWKLFADNWQDQERQDAAELRRLVDLAELHCHGDGGLLPARDLARVERWKERVHGHWSRRYVDEAQWKNALGYVEASKEAVDRKLGAYFAMGGLLLFATVFSTVQMFRARAAESQAKQAAVAAERSAKAAQEAVVQSLFRTIGTSDDLYLAA